MKRSLPSCECVGCVVGSYIYSIYTTCSCIFQPGNLGAPASALLTSALSAQAGVKLKAQTLARYIQSVYIYCTVLYICNAKPNRAADERVVLPNSIAFRAGKETSTCFLWEEWVEAGGRDRLHPTRADHHGWVAREKKCHFSGLKIAIL